MVWTKITSLLVLGLIALFAVPASAKPMGRHHAGLHRHHHSLGHASFAGARRHSHEARRHGHSHRRYVRLRGNPEAMNAYGSIPDRHVLGQESSYGADEARQPARRMGTNVLPQASSGFGGGGVVSEARRWIGGNPTGRSSLWCARFMNFVLQRTGHQTSGSDMARSFSSYGQRISGPQVGAIAVMSRGRRGGHVGVVSGIDERGNPIIISGNHGHRVAESVYSRGRIYAYVMP